jgi:hypothetical protein
MNRKTLAGDRRRRKLNTLLWALGVTAVVVALIYFEKTAILYILCTLGVTALLLVVAFADLGENSEAARRLDQQKDAASVADRIS